MVYCLANTEQIINHELLNTFIIGWHRTNIHKSFIPEMFFIIWSILNSISKSTFGQIYTSYELCEHFELSQILFLGSSVTRLLFLKREVILHLYKSLTRGKYFLPLRVNSSIWNQLFYCSCEFLGQFQNRWEPFGKNNRTMGEKIPGWK